MNSPLYARGDAIVPISTPVNLTGLEGYFYKRDASNNAIAITSATDVPDGVILDAGNSFSTEISAAIAGGAHNPMRIKLGAAVTDLRKALVLRADGTAGPDTGAGARVVVAKPIETGAVGEKIAAVLLAPVSYAS